jgi:hypothetical protein
MFENEYLMQVTVADRLREARATAWRVTQARLANDTRATTSTSSSRMVPPSISTARRDSSARDGRSQCGSTRVPSIEL